MTAPTPPWLESSPGPNGRPVRENFIDWFRGSVIAGGDGAPFVLAHGTTKEFDVFEPSKGGAQGPGIYMAQVAPGAKAEYGDRTLELVVHMRNPFSWNASEESYDAMVDGQLLEHVLGAKRAAKVVDRIDRDGINAYGTELVTELRKHGHDGLVVVPPWSRGFLAGDNVVIAWEARQVKLAYGNTGIFSKSASLSDRPMSLGEQVRHAQAVVATWSPEKRASVQLEGSDFHTAPRRRARP
jgi:hypothetical protein